MEGTLTFKGRDIIRDFETPSIRPKDAFKQLSLQLTSFGKVSLANKRLFLTGADCLVESAKNRALMQSILMRICRNEKQAAEEIFSERTQISRQIEQEILERYRKIRSYLMKEREIGREERLG